MFKPYPKMLYLDGDTSRAWKIAQDADEAEKLRRDGYAEAGEKIERSADKPRRKTRGAP